jgi:transcriptional regulator with XRE-family HTH domain
MIDRLMNVPQILVTSGDNRLAKERLAQLVKDLRGRVTQREFAKRLGTSYTAVQDWEKQIRLPSDKNLKRIAELKGWTQEELIRYIFCPDTYSTIDFADPIERIIAQVRELSQEQVQRLMDYLNTQLSANWKGQEDVMKRCLSDQQKHNLHLLLRASLKGQSPMEAMAQARVEPALFTDIFLRDDKNRVVTYEDLEKLSSLCCQVIKWAGNQPPKIDCAQTYASKTELLFNDLAEENKAQID